TITYVPKDEQKKRARRRMLIGAVAAVAVLAAAWLGKLFFFSPTPNVDGPERLHGVRVGEEWLTACRQARVPGLGGDMPPNTWVNPWKRPHTRALMSPALREADLGADEKKAGELAFSYSTDAHVVVILDHNSVVGILSTSPQARTNRGVGVGSDAGLIAKR